MDVGSCIALTQYRLAELQEIGQMLFDNLNENGNFHCLVVVHGNVAKASHALEICSQFRLDYACLL